MRGKMIALVFAVLLGCHTATPEGSTLFVEELESRSGLETKHEETVSLGAKDATRLRLVIESVDIANEKHIARITGVVVTSGGWEVSKQSMGNPVNVGTEQDPVMEVPILFQQYKVTACGQTIRQHHVRVRANGIVRVD